MAAGQPHVARCPLRRSVLRRQLQRRGAARGSLAHAHGVVRRRTRRSRPGGSESISTRTAIPIPPSPDFSFLSASPYVRKDAVLTAIAEGARTQIRLDVYDRKREFLQEVLAGRGNDGCAASASCATSGRELYGEIRLRYEDILRGEQTVDAGPDGLPRLRPGRDAAPHLGGVRNFTRSAEAGCPGAFRRSRIRRRMGWRFGSGYTF